MIDISFLWVPLTENVGPYHFTKLVNLVAREKI